MGLGDERADGGYREPFAESALRSSEAGYRTLKERLNAVRSTWEVIRGADRDRLNGRPEDDVLEELAWSYIRMDELLGTDHQSTEQES